MADDLPVPADSGSPAAADTGASSSGSASTSGAQDTHAIAASVFADSDAPPAASPAASTPSDPNPPAAAISGGEDDADYQNLLASGSMPVDRHKAVLTNARNKTRAEVEQEYRAKYGWADQFDRARADKAMGLMDALDKNPEQTLRTIAQALGVNFAPPAAQEPDGPPPPDVKLEDGSEFYSAKQLAKLNAWQDAQLDRKLAALEERYKPLVAERQMNVMRAEAATEAGTILSRYRQKYKHFTALEGDIKQRMQADASLSLADAYSESLEARVIPAMEQQHSTDRASQLQRKAAASSTSPGAPRPVTPLKYAERSTRDIAAEVFSRSA